MADQFIHTDIILIDIIGFSKLSNVQQYKLITEFASLYRKVATAMISRSFLEDDPILDFISTGDGFYTILKPTVKGYGALFALSFKNYSKKLVQDIPFFKGIRIAVHTGYLIPFKDIKETTNFVGDGLNKCARYLGYEDEKSQFYDYGYTIISTDAWEFFEKLAMKDNSIYSLLEKLEFEKSGEILVIDKHNLKHIGYLIHTKKVGIAVPQKTTHTLNIEQPKQPKSMKNLEQIKKQEEKINSLKEKLQNYLDELDEWIDYLEKINSEEVRLKNLLQKQSYSSVEKELKQVQELKIKMNKEMKERFGDYETYISNLRAIIQKEERILLTLKRV